jgi:hypothetical protein
MDVLNLIIQLGGGAAGGNFIGSLSKSSNLGVLGNSIAGMVGGGIGMNVINNALGLATAATASADLDMGALAAQILGSGVGGGVMAMIVGVVRSMLSR